MSSSSFTCCSVEWRRVKPLGKGSFGEAFLVQCVSPSITNPNLINLPSDKLAVCKVIHMASMKKEERRDAQREVEVLSHLRHPNIVEFYGSFESPDGDLHILMEYCNAGDVEQLIKKQKGIYIEENVIASLFIQMSSAVRYLHERRILHRDLKAQNVFLCRRASRSAENPGEQTLIAKLGDFGIATVLRNTLALAKTICGTPYYFSPELCLNRPYNNKSDVWSLGCILYEMCTLKHAFDANNMKALMARILTGQYTALPSSYHASLQSLVDGMLQQKVDRRMSIQQVLKAPFVMQHTERMYLAHDLETSMKKQQRQQQQQANVHIASSGGGGGSRPLNPQEARAKQVQQRRMDQEAKLLERKHEIEDQRRRRNIRAAQNYDRHREKQSSKVAELERLDDIRRRIEICSYEEQQRYVDEGWKLIQDTRLKQAEREKQYDLRDEQIQSLMDQMQKIDAKMQSRRQRREHQPPAREPTAKELALAYKNRVSADAPWNRNREAPVGFTKESWEAHRRIMANGEGVEGGGGGGGRPPSGSPQARRPSTQGAVPSGTTALPPAAGRLSDRDASMMIKAEKNRLKDDPSYQQEKLQEAEKKKLLEAQAQWEAQRKKIRVAEGVVPPDAEINDESELLWMIHKKRLEDARKNDARPPELGKIPQQPTTQFTYNGISPPRPPPQPPSLPPVHTGPGGVGLCLPNVGRFNENMPVVLRKPSVSPPSSNAYPPPPPPPAGDDEDSDYSSDEDEYDDTVTESEEEDEEEDNYGRVIHEMKQQALRPDPPELFEEPQLPANDLSRLANTVKFTLDGKTLHLPGVHADSGPAARVEALKLFLADALGGQRSFQRLISSLEEIQSAEVDETLADAMLQKLQVQYGTKSSFVDLAVQLLVCEGMLKGAS